MVFREIFDLIFECFSRLTPAYEGVYKGSGLGLYTVKRYVKAMQGTLQVNSEVGQGTCFTVILPLTVADPVPRAKHSIRVPTTPRVVEPLVGTQNSVPIKEAEASVLIVEDHPLAAIAATMALQPFHCHTETAENGAKAVEKAQAGHYDLILMDIGLPDFSGVEVTKKIRALTNPKKSQVPIVALTGHANNPEMRQEAIDAGMQEVLSKPAQPRALESILQNYVFKTRAEQPSTQEAVNPLRELRERSGGLAARKVIDWEASVRQCAGDSDLARTMLLMLVDDLKNTKAILAEAYAKGDTKALRAELHRSRGGVCYLSLPQLNQALKTFHQAVKSDPQDPKELALTYTALQEAMEAFWKTVEGGQVLI